MDKYRLDSLENKRFLEEIRNNLLRFGERFASPSGASYYLGADGTPIKDNPRETWITSRMVHVYSIAAIMGVNGAKELAQKGLNGLCTELHDKKYGGWYAGVAADGSPLEDKQCYAHAFVLLAASSALLAGIDGAKELLDQAKAVYDKYFWDEEAGLARDTWSTEFTKCSSYRGLNANMHSVEAFLAVSDATGDEEYRNRAGRIIKHVLQWAEANNWRIPEHFSENWKPMLDYNKEFPEDRFKPFGSTPGHGIEWARLIVQYSEKNLDAAMKLFDRAVLDGWKWDNKGGFAYTADWNGKPVVKDRYHWTLAEGINTAAVLYSLSKKPEYSSFYAEEMEYLDKKVLDHDKGSWFHQLDEDGHVRTNVWPGKPDLYHALQATLIPYLPNGVSIAKAVID